MAAGGGSHHGCQKPPLIEFTKIHKRPTPPEKREGERAALITFEKQSPQTRRRRSPVIRVCRKNLDNAAASLPVEVFLFVSVCLSVCQFRRPVLTSSKKVRSVDGFPDVSPLVCRSSNVAGFHPLPITTAGYSLLLLSIEVSLLRRFFSVILTVVARVWSSSPVARIKMEDSRGHTRLIPLNYEVLQKLRFSPSRLNKFQY